MLVHNYCYLVKLNSHAHIQLSHPICNHNPKIFSKGNFLFYFKLIHKYCDTHVLDIELANILSLNV
jgi:hypothetical protein